MVRTLKEITSGGAKFKAPYGELDRNIIKLVRALNSFAGIQTIGSCGGHKDPQSYQQPKGSWLITLEVDHSEEGWFALEFLAWFVNNNLVRGGWRVQLTLHAFPPFINVPGEALYFALAGEGETPDLIAQELRAAKKGFYVSPADFETFAGQFEEVNV
jgi:hypothetical protein